MKDRNDFTLRDLLYLDFEKAASIWSQFEEGLLESVSVTEDTGKDRAAGTKFGIPGLVKASAEYQELQQLISEARVTANQEKDRNTKAAIRAKIKALEDNVAELSKPQVNTVEPWLIDAMREWIDTFMPNRINFRIYPFLECPSFQVLCNLKRECFIDSDLEHLLYGYGNRPNVRLAVFGLITSMPAIAGPPFDPLREFSERTDLSNEEVFESAFRGVFGGMDGLEALSVIRDTQMLLCIRSPFTVRSRFGKTDERII
jgi:hypothetical protein